MIKLKELFEPKELTPSQSFKKVKELLKERKIMKDSDMIPGNLIFTFYDAKYKEFTFDRTPLLLILRRNRKYTLGLAFHWIPVKLRLKLIQYIMSLNKFNIKHNRPLEFTYLSVKPLLKSLAYAPCIRLYINKRIGPRGVVIPPDRLVEVARLKTETFTNGKYSAMDLFKFALKKYAKKGIRKIKKVLK